MKRVKYFPRVFVLIVWASLGLNTQSWADAPKIAVTDLCYQERVREYFQYYEAHEKHDRSASAHERYRDSDNSSSGSSSGSFKEKGEASVIAASGVIERIDIGEMRKFTGDIKGQLIKAGYRISQGKPWTQRNTENIYDIINRIKQGYYPGADYVLFGTVTNIEFMRDDNPLQGSNATSHTLALELVAEFSLVNTKTYEVVAGFSATGEGRDTKLTNAPGTTLTLNRGRVMRDVSVSLGETVAQEVEAQFPLEKAEK